MTPFEEEFKEFVCQQMSRARSTCAEEREKNWRKLATSQIYVWNTKERMENQKQNS